MSSTPTLEMRAIAEQDLWVDIVPRKTEARYSGASILVAISKIRDAVALGDDEGIVIDTATFRDVDEMDIEAANHAEQRWAE